MESTFSRPVERLRYARVLEDRRAVSRSLDLACGAPQTRSMAHTYIRFDFGTDEEKAQQARHKLDGWRQAFRLDKRVQYKMDRPESAVVETVSKPEAVEKPAPATKSKAKPAAKTTAKAAEKSSEPAAEKPAAAMDGKVGLLVRLYFSSYEKLSEQRWPRSRSRVPLRRSSTSTIRNSKPQTRNSNRSRDLRIWSVFGFRDLRPNWPDDGAPKALSKKPIWADRAGNPL